VDERRVVRLGDDPARGEEAHDEVRELLAAEVATGVALRGVSLRDALINRDPVSGSLYYFSLALFAVLPALRAGRWRRARR